MDKTVTFVVLFGLPGSGKSTFAKMLAGRCKEEGLLCVETSRDGYRHQEDGSYKFVPAREPAIQAAHLETLHQLSEERFHDVVIVDDANLSEEQVIGTLLAISGDNNNVFLVDFVPLPHIVHTTRLAENGHEMPPERFVEMRRVYSETEKKVNELNIHTYTIKVDKEAMLERRTDEQQMAAFEATASRIINDIKSGDSFNFELLGFRVERCSWVKRNLLDIYKQHVLGAIREGEDEPASKKQKQ